MGVMIMVVGVLGFGVCCNSYLLWRVVYCVCGDLLVMLVIWRLFRCGWVVLVI